MHFKECSSKHFRKICHSKINKWKHQKDSEGDVNVLGSSDQLMSCQRTCCAQHPVVCRLCWLSVGTSVTVTVRVNEERVDTHHTAYLYNVTGQKGAIASLQLLKFLSDRCQEKVNGELGCFKEPNYNLCYSFLVLQTVSFWEEFSQLYKLKFYKSVLQYK